MTPKGEKCRAHLFATMSPLEAKRVLLGMYAVQPNRIGGMKQKSVFIGVKKAHVTPACECDDIYVEFPAGARPTGKYGRLLRWLYGMRGAAQSWVFNYIRRLRTEGFIKGKSAPTVLYNGETSTRVVVYVGDSTLLGFEDNLNRMTAHMFEWYEINVRGILGDDTEYTKDITILNILVKVTKEGLEYKADPKHVRFIYEKMGIGEDAKLVQTPCLI